MAGGKRDLRHPPETGVTPGDAKASAALGELLRAARDRRGLSLDQISRETKIPTRCLAALEHGDLAALPGGTYTRGEVIAFATAVGLDKQVALDHLDRSLHPAPSSVAEKGVRAPVATTQRSTARIAAIAVLAILMTAWAAREYNARVLHQQALAVEDAQSASKGSPTTAADMQPARRAEREAAPTVRSPSTSAASTGTVSRAAQKGPAAAADVNSGAPAAAADDGSLPGSPVNVSAPALTVVSDPPGARVTIDGIGWGSTPVTISHVAPGAKRIRVTLGGYPAVERTVQIATTGTTRIVIPLSAQ